MRLPSPQKANLLHKYPQDEVDHARKRVEELLSKGQSYRQISRHLKRYLRFDVSLQTIHKWAREWRKASFDPDTNERLTVDRYEYTVTPDRLDLVKELKFVLAHAFTTVRFNRKLGNRCEDMNLRNKFYLQAHSVGTDAVKMVSQLKGFEGIDTIDENDQTLEIRYIEDNADAITEEPTD